MSTGDPAPVVRWRVCAVDGDAAVAGHARLSPDERARAPTISHPGARQRFVVGRALLRRTIAEHRPELDDTPSITVAASGRPYLDAHAEVEISLGHTHGLAVAAVADGMPVGIDVEPLDREPPAVSGTWLTPQEQARLAVGAPDPAELLRRWVAKEAALKASDQLGPAGLSAIEIHGSALDEAAPGTVRSVPPPAMDPPADGVEIGRGQAIVSVDHLPAGASAATDDTGDVAVVLPVTWFEVATRFVVAVVAR